MTDFLDKLAETARETIDSGYYSIKSQRNSDPLSLKEAIESTSHTPIITEIKTSSPSQGVIRNKINTIHVAREMMHNGAVGISVLTEPKHFNGSLETLKKVRKVVDIPVLMKDIILGQDQLRAAQKIGADTVLLIKSVYDKGYGEFSLEEMIQRAHLRQLEVLLETHNKNEFIEALETDADLIGINNRNLKNLKVDLRRTQRILRDMDTQGKLIVSESGIKTPENICFLRECGAHAFLIGTSIMKSEEIGKTVRRFASS